MSSVLARFGERIRELSDWLKHLTLREQRRAVAALVIYVLIASAILVALGGPLGPRPGVSLTLIGIAAGAVALVAALVAAVLFNRTRQPSAVVDPALRTIKGTKTATPKQPVPDSLRVPRVRVSARGVDLSGIDLKEADLKGADLTGARLIRALLAGTHLERALLVRARLDDANLVNAHLEFAVLSGASLRRASLSGAHLENADLSSAVLRNADLSGADLSGAKLTDAVLEGVLSDRHTRWPRGYKRPARRRSSRPV